MRRALGSINQAASQFQTSAHAARVSLHPFVFETRLIRRVQEVNGASLGDLSGMPRGHAEQNIFISSKVFITVYSGDHAMAARTSMLCLAMSPPRMVCLPSVGRMTVMSILMVVVLLRRLGPRKPKISPFLTLKSTCQRLLEFWL